MAVGCAGVSIDDLIRKQAVTVRPKKHRVWKKVRVPQKVGFPRHRWNGLHDAGLENSMDFQSTHDAGLPVAFASVRA